ncbi:MAG: dodecin family protein [Microthrixaceae bacterium]
MSVYKVIELVGTSEDSWEDAAVNAVTLAQQSLRDVRVAEVIEQDMDLTAADVITFRTKLRVSFKFEGQ